VIYSAGDTEEYLAKVSSLNAEKATAMDQVEKLLSTPKGQTLFASMREKTRPCSARKNRFSP
jgi:methyl-accepting chemotaxis protein